MLILILAFAFGAALAYAALITAAHVILQRQNVSLTGQRDEAIRRLVALMHENAHLKSPPVLPEMDLMGAGSTSRGVN